MRVSRKPTIGIASMIIKRPATAPDPHLTPCIRTAIGASAAAARCCENSTSPIMNRIALAIAKLRSLNRCRSTIGCLAFHSQMIAATIAMTADDRRPADQRRSEPVIPLALVEHDLQAPRPSGDQPKADVVDVETFALMGSLGFELRRVVARAGWSESAKGCRSEC